MVQMRQQDQEEQMRNEIGREREAELAQMRDGWREPSRFDPPRERESFYGVASPAFEPGLNGYQPRHARDSVELQALLQVLQEREQVELLTSQGAQSTEEALQRKA